MCCGINDDGTKCKDRGRYGYKNIPPQHCRKHAAADMINLAGYICQDCNSRAAFGFKKGDKELYCGVHMKFGMINVLNIMCLICGTKQPTYNIPGEKKPLYCVSCALDGMVNVKDKKCKGCGKVVPVYGYPGGKVEYCTAHKLDGMIDLTKDNCIEPNCHTIASFNFPNIKPQIYCFKHKKEGMVNNHKQNCKFTGCPITPSFGIDGTIEYCAGHALPGMISRHENKYCPIKDCERTVSYGFVDGIKEYCKDHALPDMVNLKYPTCKCGKIATFNFPTQKPITCKKHADTGMIDVTAPRCDCGTTAGFGLPGNKPTKCVQHKIPGMIPNPTKRCTTKPCKEYAIYGLNQALHCEDHKEDNEYNLIEKECSSCKLFMILNDKDLCGFCDPTMVKTFQLAKQKEIKTLLDSKKIKYTLYDRIIDSQCGYERPDFLFDCGTHIVIIEVDEQQHRKNQCDDVRMFNISQTLALKTIFIRYNPDDYKVNNKKQNTTKIKKHETLLRCLDTMRKKNVQEIDFVSAIYLFYDDYGESKSILEKIEPEITIVKSKKAIAKPKKKIEEISEEISEELIIVKPKKTTVTKKITTKPIIVKSKKVMAKSKKIIEEISEEISEETIIVKPKKTIKQSEDLIIVKPKKTITKSNKSNLSPQ